MEKRKLYRVLILSLIVLIISCESTSDKIITNKVVCVLFDLSETTNTTETRRTYLDKFKMILDKMNSGDAIEAALITEKSVSELNLSIEHTFPAFNPNTDNDMLIAAQKKKNNSALQIQKDSLLNVADSVLFNPPRKVMGTEILSSLQVAERVLSSFPQEKKVLVIFSDMVEESAIANFAKDNLPDKQIKRLIEKLRQSDMLPVLKNTIIYVAGATHPSTAKYNRIRTFWRDYFKETGAIFENQNYGAALIRFEE